MKVFGYVHVSKEDENSENQEVAVMEFAKANSIKLIKVFKDIGVSGGEPTLSRSEFQKNA